MKPHGCAPFGWRYLDGRLVHDKREQYIIGQCRGLAARGFTLEQIVRGLNAIGTNRAGGKFTIEQARRMLRPRDSKGVRAGRADRPLVVRVTEEEAAIIASVVGEKFSPWARKLLVSVARQEKALKDAEKPPALVSGAPLQGPVIEAFTIDAVAEETTSDVVDEESLTDELARTLYDEASSWSSKRSGRKRSTVTGNGSVSSGDAGMDGIVEGGGDGIVDAGDAAGEDGGGGGVDVGDL